MKKALMISTVIDFLAAFEVNDIRILQNIGYEVHCACNCKEYTDKIKIKDLMDTGIIKHHIPFARRPFHKSNIMAYKALKNLIKKEQFDLVHCHTPVGGVLGRMAAHRNLVPVVIYTAHGFHFYDGAPLINWLVFYSIEKWLSRYTDVLISINKEDYKRAKRKFYAKKTVYIPGVGLNTEKFITCTVDKEKKREELSIPTDAKLLISIGELSIRKNHKVVIKALAHMQNNSIYYIIVGKGMLEVELRKLVVSFGLQNQVFFLGYRTDIQELLCISDVFVFPSLQEGLSVALMEAMASGLPVVCSRIRGNTDLIDEGEGGYFFEPTKIDDIAKCIERLPQNAKNKLGTYNIQKIKKFDFEIVEKLMEEVYRAF